MRAVIGHRRSSAVIGPVTVMGHRSGHGAGPVMGRNNASEKKWADDGPTGPPLFYLSIYIAPHEIFWPFWIKNKVLTSDNKAVRNSGMTLNYL